MGCRPHIGVPRRNRYSWCSTETDPPREALDSARAAVPQTYGPRPDLYSRRPGSGGASRSLRGGFQPKRTYRRFDDFGLRVALPAKRGVAFRRPLPGTRLRTLNVTVSRYEQDLETFTRRFEIVFLPFL